MFQAEVFPSLDRRCLHLLKDGFGFIPGAVGVLDVEVGQLVGGHFAGVARQIGLVSILRACNLHIKIWEVGKPSKSKCRACSLTRKTLSLANRILAAFCYQNWWLPDCLTLHPSGWSHT